MATKPFMNEDPLRGSTSFYDFSQGTDGRTLPAAADAPDTVEKRDEVPEKTDDVATPASSVNNGSSSTTSTTSTTTAVSGRPYVRFQGNNYADLEEYLRSQMKNSKAETPEERERRERREKRTAFLARLADGIGTFHTAFSHARGVNPMEMPNLSRRAEELYERARILRDRDRDRWVNYAITLGKIKDANRDYDFRVEKARRQQENWQTKYDTDRQDRADDVDFRNKKLDADKERWQKNLDENQRQFEIKAKEQARHNRRSEGLQGASIAEQRSRTNLAQQRYSSSEDKKYTEFYTGNGMIRIPNTRLNAHNLSYVFKKTPASGRPTGGYNMTTGQTTPVSQDQMMNWIGSNIDSPDVQSALREIGGVATAADNTPPSRRNNNSNTPPSRRNNNSNTPPSRR